MKTAALEEQHVNANLLMVQTTNRRRFDVKNDETNKEREIHLHR